MHYHVAALTSYVLISFKYNNSKLINCHFVSHWLKVIEHETEGRIKQEVILILRFKTTCNTSSGILSTLSTFYQHPNHFIYSNLNNSHYIIFCLHNIMTSELCAFQFSLKPSLFFLLLSSWIFVNIEDKLSSSVNA